MKRRYLAVPLAKRDIQIGGASRSIKQSKENLADGPKVSESQSVQYFAVLYTKKMPNKVTKHYISQKALNWIAALILRSI